MTRFRTDRACAILAAVVATTWVVWLLSGCGMQRKEEPLLGAKPVPQGRIAEGQVAFMHACYQCHPGGAAGLGPAINNKPLPRTLIKTQVRIGGGAMPAFPKERLPDEQLDEIVDYIEWLRSLHPRNG
jgi:mono/diheme cytochrome c family protein